jgi:phospholipid/cholesterol/gamma-HCH transport system substrate-binding protein
MNRSTARELRVGLVVLVGLAALLSLLVLARVGPGFLGPRRTLDVVFKDGQGIRVGCPVRVAGVDAGRVLEVRLFEDDDGLRVRLKLTLPAEVADHFRQDVQIAIQPGLTGQSTVNVLSAGRSRVALVPGQSILGVESSMFDPLLEQIGLGAGERDRLRETVAQVREAIDGAAPRIQQTLAALADTSTEIRGLVASLRPRVEATAQEVEEIVRGLDADRINDTMARLQNTIQEVDALIGESRPLLAATLTSVEALTGELRGIAVDNRENLSALVAGLTKSQIRLDDVLADAQVISEQGAQIATQNRADIERTLANVRDATGFGLKLVQKLYGNPFYLSPFYKPRPEDIAAQEVYDSANAFLLGAKEFHDALKGLQAMQGKTMSPREKEAYNRLFQRAWDLTGQLQSLQTQLAQGIRQNTAPPRR